MTINHQDKIMKDTVGYLVVDDIYKKKLMGLVQRKKSGKILNGSKLIVPGQGVSTVKGSDDDKRIPKGKN